jgi:hypothetical protein
VTLLYACASLVLEEDGIEGRYGNASTLRISLEADSERESTAECTVATRKWK